VNVVLDTNVLLAALRSSRGASHRLLLSVGTGRFELALSVPLVLEYEEVILRHHIELGLSKTDVEDILDYLCAVAIRQRVYYLWRPFLPDPKDDMLLELAVAADCQAIITFNLKDFLGVGEFGIEAIQPKQFPKQIGGLA
jgi:putative PIN family toxin of toxin-antitoxin system